MYQLLWSYSKDCFTWLLKKKVQQIKAVKPEKLLLCRVRAELPKVTALQPLWWLPDMVRHAQLFALLQSKLS